jgi:hypothetical protein
VLSSVFFFVRLGYKLTTLHLQSALVKQVLYRLSHTSSPRVKVNVSEQRHRENEGRSETEFRQELNGLLLLTAYERGESLEDYFGVVGFSSKDNGDAINEGNLKGKILEY